MYTGVAKYENIHRNPIVVRLGFATVKLKNVLNRAQLAQLHVQHDV